MPPCRVAAQAAPLDSAPRHRQRAIGLCSPESVKPSPARLRLESYCLDLFAPSAPPDRAPVLRETTAEYRAAHRTRSACAAARGGWCSPACPLDAALRTVEAGWCVRESTPPPIPARLWSCGTPR